MSGVVVIQHCEVSKCHRMVNLMVNLVKMVNLMLYEFHLNFKKTLLSL